MASNKKNTLEERRKSVLKRRHDHLTKKLNDVEEPIILSLAVAGIWVVVLVVLGIVLAQINGNSYVVNFMTSFAVGLAICLIWLIVRLGFGEKVRLRFKNYRNARIARKAELPNNRKFTMSIDDYRAFVKKHSWVGIFVLLGVSSLVTLITALVYYL